MNSYIDKIIHTIICTDKKNKCFLNLQLESIKNEHLSNIGRFRAWIDSHKVYDSDFELEFRWWYVDGSPMSDYNLSTFYFENKKDLDYAEYLKVCCEKSLAAKEWIKDGMKKGE